MCDSGNYRDYIGVIMGLYGDLIFRTLQGSGQVFQSLGQGLLEDNVHGVGV